MKLIPKQVELDAFQWYENEDSGFALIDWLKETCGLKPEEMNWLTDGLFRVMFKNANNHIRLLVVQFCLLYQKLI